MHSVLIIESDDRLLNLRAEQLLMDGYDVDAATTPQTAQIKLAGRPDALVLCNAGGGPKTVALLRHLRAGEITGADRMLPVLVVGADDDSAAVRYYRAGADLTLPSRSSPLLVAAGLESLARRTGTEQRRQIARVGALTVDRDARTVQVDHRPVRLTRREFDLLATLAAQPRKAFSRAEITRAVWGYEPDLAGPSRTIDSHAHRLRTKLAQSGAGPMVHNVRGVGWRLTP